MRSHPCFVPLLLACLFVVSCDEGGGGDEPTIPLATTYGDGARIPDIIQDATWLDSADMTSEACTYPPDVQAYVTGVTIVAIDHFDETGEGSQGNFYVQDTFAQDLYQQQDPSKKASFGATMYAPSFSPPDLRLAQGDVTDILGGFTEFPGPSSAGKFPYCRTLPEFSGTMSFRFEGGHVDPVDVTLDMLSSYDSARYYIGMLVRIKDVTIAGTPAKSGVCQAASGCTQQGASCQTDGDCCSNSCVGGVCLATGCKSQGASCQSSGECCSLDCKGRYTVPLMIGVPVPDIVHIANELYDIEKEGPALALDTTFSSITGVLTYFYGFKISPRSPADFEP